MGSEFFVSYLKTYTFSFHAEKKMVDVFTKAKGFVGWFRVLNSGLVEGRVRYSTLRHRERIRLERAFMIYKTLKYTGKKQTNKIFIL